MSRNKTNLRGIFRSERSDRFRSRPLQKLRIRYFPKEIFSFHFSFPYIYTFASVFARLSSNGLAIAYDLSNYSGNAKKNYYRSCRSGLGYGSKYPVLLRGVFRNQDGGGGDGDPRNRHHVPLPNNNRTPFGVTYFNCGTLKQDLELVRGVQKLFTYGKKYRKVYFFIW